VSYPALKGGASSVKIGFTPPSSAGSKAMLPHPADLNFLLQGSIPLDFWAFYLDFLFIQAFISSPSARFSVIMTKNFFE
jgi:hypothetical protein